MKGMIKIRVIWGYKERVLHLLFFDQEYRAVSKTDKPMGLIVLCGKIDNEYIKYVCMSVVRDVLRKTRALGMNGGS